jgi:hypothetical protein
MRPRSGNEPVELKAHVSDADRARAASAETLALGPFTVTGADSLDGSELSRPAPQVVASLATVVPAHSDHAMPTRDTQPGSDHVQLTKTSRSAPRSMDGTERGAARPKQGSRQRRRATAGTSLSTEVRRSINPGVSHRPGARCDSDPSVVYLAMDNAAAQCSRAGHRSPPERGPEHRVCLSRVPANAPRAAHRVGWRHDRGALRLSKPPAASRRDLTLAVLYAA